MLLITEAYRALNAELHQRVPSYGTGAHKWADFILELVANTGAKSVLDYGCGKGTLKDSMPGLKVYEYDPALEHKRQLPESAGVVCCLDVMEHVEPQCTLAVIEHMCSLATRAVFVVVSCRESGKTLADGSPAHINVKPASWWQAVFRHFGDFRSVRCQEHEYAAVWVKHG